MDVQLFSPQTYHQIQDVHYIIEGYNVQMVLKNHKIVITINIQEDKLPIIYNYYVTSAQKKHHGPLLSVDSTFKL